MMTTEQMILIIGMALVTYIPRAVPILFFANHDVSVNVKKWLQYIPSAVFSALVCSDIFFWEGELTMSLLTNKKLIPSVLVLLVALKTKSLTWSIAVGLGSLAIFFYIF